MEDEKTGFLFKAGDCRDLANKLQILINDDKLAKTLGQAGRQKAIKKYNANNYIDHIIRIYKNELQ